MSGKYLLVVAFALISSIGLSPAGAQQTPVIHLAIGSTDTSAAGYWALDSGIFKKNGLNVEIIQTRGGAASAAAIAGGSADFADGNIVTFANAHIHDIPFVAIAPGYMYDSRDPYAVIAVAKNSPYKSAKDLEGKIIGEPSLGGMAEGVVGTWLEKNGSDPKSVKFVEVPPGETTAALDTGRVAAAVFQDPQLSEQRDQVRIFPAYDAVAKRRIDTVFYTTINYANKNPDTVKRFQQSIREATAWADKNPELAKQSLSKWMKTNITKIRNFHVDTLDPALMQPLIDSAARYGIIPKRVNAADLIYVPAR